MKSNRSVTTSPRTAAAGLVAEWLATGRFPDRLLGARHEDRAFLVEVVYGIARWRRMLEWVVHRYAKHRPPVPVMSCLLVGLYQILVMDGVAPYAAVNETVDAVRPAGRKAVGFVNALLRRALRDIDALRSDLAAAPLGIRESHPDLLVQRWTRHYGELETRALCQWNNRRPCVIVRPDTRHTTFDRFMKQLESAGIAPHPHPGAPRECIVLPHGVRVTDLPGYEAGHFTVQDPATCRAVHLLAPKPGERVLDACAAPGGKTLLIVQAMQNTGDVVAMEKHRDRLPLLEQNLARSKASSVTTVCADASDTDAIARLCTQTRFDRILLDVPCTNTGVLARRPDARWRFSLSRLEKLTGLQRALLDTASLALKPRGTLVYSTCSLEPEENAKLVRDWLRRHPEFKTGGRWSSFPPDSGTDGGFAVALSHTRD